MTMKRPNMIVWLTPSMISGTAIGNFTFQRVCRRVQPAIVDASTSGSGTFWIPKIVYRMAGTDAERTTATMIAVSETSKNMMAGNR